MLSCCIIYAQTNSGTVFVFVGLAACSIAAMRRRSSMRVLIWLGIWSAMSGERPLLYSLEVIGPSAALDRGESSLRRHHIQLSDLGCRCARLARAKPREAARLSSVRGSVLGIEKDNEGFPHARADNAFLRLARLKLDVTRKAGNRDAYKNRPQHSAYSTSRRHGDVPYPSRKPLPWVIAGWRTADQH